MSERVAAIDCGTNSVRLLVAQGRPEGGFDELDRRLHLTRLGQGVDATGAFHTDAVARTFVALDDYAAELADLEVGRVRLVATSAARDARNREEFFAGVRERLGVEAEIISGEEEARLSFEGALSATPGAPVPVLVMDIGGGSTELALAGAGLSLDMGSVRLRERFLHSDPPTAAEVAAARAFVDGLLDACGLDLAAARTWIGVGGTATALSALAQGLEVYDRARVHGSVVGLDDLAALADRLLGLTVAETTALPTMVPGRADVLCAGALICRAVGARTRLPLAVSEADILDGLVLDLLRRG